MNGRRKSRRRCSVLTRLIALRGRVTVGHYVPEYEGDGSERRGAATKASGSGND